MNYFIELNHRTVFVICDCVAIFESMIYWNGSLYRYVLCFWSMYNYKRTL